MFDAGKDAQAQLTSDSLQQATSELRTLLERFANGMSLGVIGEAMRVLYDDAQKDEGLKDWFRSVDSYCRKVVFVFAFHITHETYVEKVQYCYTKPPLLYYSL